MSCPPVPNPPSKCPPKPVPPAKLNLPFSGKVVGAFPYYIPAEVPSLPFGTVTEPSIAWIPGFTLSNFRRSFPGDYVIRHRPEHKEEQKPIPPQPSYYTNPNGDVYETADGSGYYIPEIA